IKSAARREGNVLPARLETHPLLADAGAAALDQNAVVVVGAAPFAWIVAGIEEAAALDDEVVLVARRCGQRCVVLKLPGNVADNSPLFFNIEKLLARPAPL